MEFAFSLTTLFCCRRLRVGTCKLLDPLSGEKGLGAVRGSSEQRWSFGGELGGEQQVPWSIKSFETCGVGISLLYVNINSIIYMLWK